MNKKEIGKYLEKLRHQKGVGRTEAASSIGTTYKSILDWENGVMPSNESLLNLAKYYGVTVDDILECGKLITYEELYDKFPDFKPIESRIKEGLPEKYEPYQQRLLNINIRLKELIHLFKKRTLSRSEDFELRFLFEKMCVFSDYYYEEHDDSKKEKYLCFIEILNEAKEKTKTSPEYFYEVNRYIEIANWGYHNPFPEYAEIEKDPIKDEQFKSLEDWQKDFYLAAIQNSDVINDPYNAQYFLKDYEDRYGKKFDKEVTIKKLIRYFINNGAKLNPWLLSFIEKRKIECDILMELENIYLDFIKPIFIQFHDPKSDDGEYKYAYVKNTQNNRFLGEYTEYYIPSFCSDRLGPKEVYKMLMNYTEEDMVKYLYEQLKDKGDIQSNEFDYKKARVNTFVQQFFKSKKEYVTRIEEDKKRLNQLALLEEKFYRGEKTYFEYQYVDIAKNKNFDHFKMMKEWKNDLNYSEYLKHRDNLKTQELLKDLDSLSLEEIRNIFFAKEEIDYE